MTAQSVWTCTVAWDRAQEILRLGCGKLVIQWDDRIWQYWKELGWDQRPSSELDTQPDEVQAYLLNPFEVLLLGLWPAEPTSGVLFVIPDIQWAAVASNTRMEVEDA